MSEISPVTTAMLQKAFDQLVTEVIEQHLAPSRLVLLGIANGGVQVATRLAARLTATAPHLTLRIGTLDVSFHRDDIGRHPIPKEFAPTLIPVDVTGANVILIDDVLFSGRTIKAALDELFDHGRPARVELAVLIDRGGHRLPIAADFCGLRLDLPDHTRLVVHLSPLDPALDTCELRQDQPKTRETLLTSA